MTMTIRSSSVWIQLISIFCVGAWERFAVASAERSTLDVSKCEKLNTTLTYSQENAPKDISAVLPLIVERVNKELDGVVDVEVLFTGGDIHQRVGEHSVRCSVTRLITASSYEEQHQSNKQFETSRGTDEYGRDLVTQCFLVPFTILDINECLLPLGNPLRHACPDPSYCVNTIGSYECICPKEGSNLATVDHSREKTVDDSFWREIQNEDRSPWELSFASSSKSSCPGKASTYGCCEEESHDEDGRQCRFDFKCPIDPCAEESMNDCVTGSTCKRSMNPLDRPINICACPDGFMGNGRRCRKGIDPQPMPMLKFDGITPSDETVQNDYYCGCTRPVVDPCAGFPKCEGKNEICAVGDGNKPLCSCKPGYVKVEKFGCVDEQPPILKLRNDPNGDGITRLKQGEIYREFAVDVVDENAEDYMRSLKLTYSRPLPPGCLESVGSFHVNYTVATPWTTPPYVSVTRNVIIDDVDECKLDVERYASQCPKLVPNCDIDAGALCHNTMGSYSCKCPRFTSGDGFKFISSIQQDENGDFIDAPVGYKGGTGCHDTSKPVIEVLGPNPKIFRTCKCGGLIGVMDQAKKSKGYDRHEDQVTGKQRERYEDDIKRMIKHTSGGELCASPTMRDPSPEDCVRATDHTYRGTVDLTSKVKVGEPVQESSFKWRVPYNVIDEAGNSATTVWRTVIVEEVDLTDIEQLAREESVAMNEKELKDALLREKHLKEVIRKERESRMVKRNEESTRNQSKSEEEMRKEIREEIMREMSQRTAQTCDAYSEKEHQSDEKVQNGITSFLSSVFSANSVFTITGCTLVAISLLLLRTIVVSFVFRRTKWNYLGSLDDEKEKEMLDAVTYFRSPEHRNLVNGTNINSPSRSTQQIRNGDVGRRSGGHVGSTLFSPPGNRVYGESRQQLFANDEDTSIYQTTSPLNGHSVRRTNRL